VFELSKTENELYEDKSSAITEAPIVTVLPLDMNAITSTADSVDDLSVLFFAVTPPESMTVSVVVATCVVTLRSYTHHSA
ncbi:TPA: hypothetical protein ACIPFX_004709, partial [Salmonella enterica subsp. enterica serovar Birkenhead]